LAFFNKNPTTIIPIIKIKETNTSRLKQNKTFNKRKLEKGQKKKSTGTFLCYGIIFAKAS